MSEIPKPDLTYRRFAAFLLVVIIEAAAAVLVVIEVLGYAKSESPSPDILTLLINRSYDLAIIISILLFELWLGHEAWKYLQAVERIVRPKAEKETEG